MTAISDTENSKGKPDLVKAENLGQGKFELSLMTGKWILRFEAAHGGYAPRMRMVDVTHADHPIGKIELERKEEDYVFQGRLTRLEPPGTPPERVYVTARHEGKTFRTSTDEEGKFELRVNEPGKYVVSTENNPQTPDDYETIRWVARPPRTFPGRVLLPVGSYEYSVHVKWNTLLPRPSGNIYGRWEDETEFRYLELFVGSEFPSLFNIPWSGKWTLLIDPVVYYRNRFLSVVVPENSPPSNTHLGSIELDLE